MTDNNKPPPPPGYPKDVESGGQTAGSQPQYPGGYPTTGTAAAAGGYPAGPGSYPQVPAAGTSGAAPSGDGAYPYQQQPQPLYPGQQQQPGPHPPVWGVPAMPPVLGDRASFVYAHPMWGPDDHTRDSRFVCCAWVCFLLGFFFPIFWLISVLLPCCLPGRAVRQAALASCIASIVYAILAIILAPSMSMRHG